jgi:aminopeptidase N
MEFQLANTKLMTMQTKKPGYEADSLPSTHPIACHIQDVSAAESIFDRITYNKGCAVMRQLYEVIGRETFI